MINMSTDMLRDRISLALPKERCVIEILENVEERDRIDQTREVSPLRQADDAILLDNSHMSIAEQKKWLTEKFQAAING